jgi:hypothetical protein
MGPTAEQIELIRQYEPALYFSGPPGAPGSERFFPSDAKRYLERAALYLAKAPFASQADWGTPVVAADRLVAIGDEPAVNGEAAVFLGQKDAGGSPQYPFLQAKAGQEHFLDVSGWKPGGDFGVDLDRLASLYATDQGLNDSQFWYHAEFFDAARLRRLFINAVDPGGSAIDLTTLFNPTPGNPPVLNDPALICYYLFYPAHEESLSGCEYAPGQPVDTALDFASFAGEWSCIALLLDRPNSTTPYAPKWMGLTNRNLDITSINGQEVRTKMQLHPWGAIDLYEVTHPRLFVGSGSHGLYLSNQTPPPLSFTDPSAALCGGASSLSLGPPTVGDSDASLAFEILYAKFFAGAAEGEALFGPVGGLVGAVAGTIWGAAEFDSNILQEPTGETPVLASTTDTVNSTGLVVYPKGLRPADVDPGRGVEWRSDDNVPVAGREYFFTVDRATQVLWGDDPDGQGYTGRWGADVELDPQTRRSGMAFPKFWQIFFETLVRNDPPAIVVVLDRSAAPTWTVPKDWDANNNTVECIGGGVGGGISVAAGALPGGGGGAYAKSINLAWSAGQVINVSVGAAADNLGHAGDTYLNPSAASFPSSGQAVGARGASGVNGGSLADGYATGPGSVRNAGGSGGYSSYGGGGGGGAGGPNGTGASGGTTNPGGTAGAGGGGAGGGTAGGSTATGDAGTAGTGLNGSGSGGKGAAAPSGTADPGANGADLDGAGSGGGGGGGAGDNTNIIAATAGANGGRYGGGGGGGGTRTGVGGTPGGKGADGIIVIRYVPTS